MKNLNNADERRLADEMRQMNLETDRRIAEQRRIMDDEAQDGKHLWTQICVGAGLLVAGAVLGQLFLMAFG